MLRRAYEDSIGRSISDRQWKRIKSQLLIFQESESRMQDIRDFAFLRRMNPRSKITLGVVREYQQLKSTFPVDYVASGKQIYQGIQQLLVPTPSLRTIYRWGIEIKCPLRLRSYYSDRQLKTWAAKVIGQSNFQQIKQMNW